MRYERTGPFKGDYRRLSESQRELFRQAVRSFNAAADRFVQTRDPSEWPAALRVKPVVNAAGIFEMTWSFSGPDGRATWEWTTITDGAGKDQPEVRWRRLGDHSIIRGTS